jgi:hypothetical protein
VDSRPRHSAQHHRDPQHQQVEIIAGLLDRLLHKGIVVAIDGPSYRMRAHQQRTEQLRQAINAGTPS